MVKFNVNKYYMHLFFPTICSYPLSTCLFVFSYSLGSFLYIGEISPLYMSCLMPCGMHWSIHFLLQSFYYQLLLLCIYLFKLQIFSYEFFIYLFRREALLLHMPQKRCLWLHDGTVLCLLSTR